MTLNELKDWVIRQKAVLDDLDENELRNMGETKEGWLECELLHLFDMIEQLEVDSETK